MLVEANAETWISFIFQKLSTELHTQHCAITILGSRDNAKKKAPITPSCGILFQQAGIANYLLWLSVKLEALGGH